MPRPAARAEVREEPRLPVRDSNRVRTRRNSADVDQFHVDPDLITEGQSWEWKRSSLFGQEQRQYVGHMMEQGWEPVDAGALQQGETGPVERAGMILMERPMELTLEARAEEQAKAKAAVNNGKDEFKTNLNTDPNARPVARARPAIAQSVIEVAE